MSSCRLVLLRPVDGVEPSLIGIAISHFAVLSAEDIDIVVANDGTQFLPCLIGVRQLVLGGVRLDPSDSLIFGGVYVAT